jgi:hypothetical protein
MKNKHTSNIKIWEADHLGGIKSICTFDPHHSSGKGYYTLKVFYGNLIEHTYAWEDKINTTEQRNKWIADVAEELRYVVESSKHEIVGDRGGSLQNYYQGFANRAILCKLVECAPNESWYGNWVKNGIPHFLIMVCETRVYTKDGFKLDGTYYIWCCGNDDFDMAKRNLTLQEATELFNLAIDGVSQDELRAFGIITE